MWLIACVSGIVLLNNFLKKTPSALIRSNRFKLIGWLNSSRWPDSRVNFGWLDFTVRIVMRAHALLLLRATSWRLSAFLVTERPTVDLPRGSLLLLFRILFFHCAFTFRWDLERNCAIRLSPKIIGQLFYCQLTCRSSCNYSCLGHLPLGLLKPLQIGWWWRWMHLESDFRLRDHVTERRWLVSFRIRRDGSWEGVVSRLLATPNILVAHQKCSNTWPLYIISGVNLMDFSLQFR